MPNTKLMDAYPITHTAGEFCEFITHKAAHHFKATPVAATLLSAPVAISVGAMDVAHRLHAGQPKADAVLSPLIDLGVGLWCPGYTLTRGLAAVAEEVGPSVSQFRAQQIEKSLQEGKEQDIDLDLLYEASLAAGVGTIGQGVNRVIDKVKNCIIHPTDNAVYKAIRSGIKSFAQEIGWAKPTTPREVKTIFIQHCESAKERFHLSEEAGQQYAQLFEFAIGPRLIQRHNYIDVQHDDISETRDITRLNTKQLDADYRKIFSPFVTVRDNVTQLDELTDTFLEIANAWHNETIEGFEKEPHIKRLYDELIGAKQSKAPPSAIISKAQALKDAKTAVIAERNKIDEVAAESRNVAAIASRFCRIFDNSELANQIAVGGDSIISIGQTIGALAGYGSLAASITPIGALENISTGIENLIGLFGKRKKGDSLSMATFKAIQAIFPILGQIRDEMHERFNILEGKQEESKSLLQAAQAKLSGQMDALQQCVSDYQIENQIMHRDTHRALENVHHLLYRLSQEAYDTQLRQEASPILEAVNIFLDTPGLPSKELLLSSMQKFTTHTQRTAFSPTLSGKFEPPMEVERWNLVDKSANFAGSYINSLLYYLQSQGFLKRIESLPNPMLWSYPATALVNLFTLIYHGQSMSLDEFKIIDSTQKTANLLQDFFIQLKDPKIIDCLVENYQNALDVFEQELEKFVLKYHQNQCERLNTERAVKEREKILSEHEAFQANEIPVATDYMRQQVAMMKRSQAEFIRQHHFFSSDRLALNGLFSPGLRNTLFINPLDPLQPVLPVNINLADLLKVNPVFLQAELLGLGALSYCYQIKDNTITLKGYYGLPSSSYIKSNKRLVANVSFSLGSRFDHYEGNCRIWWKWMGFDFGEELTGYRDDDTEWLQMARGLLLEDKEGVKQRLENGECRLQKIPIVGLASLIEETKEACEQRLHALDCEIIAKLKITLTHPSCVSLNRAATHFTAAFNYLQLYVMLALHDDYDANASFSRYFKAMSMLPKSVASILNLVTKIEEDSTMSIAASLLEPLKNLSVSIPHLLEKPLLQAVKANRSETNDALLDEIIATVNICHQLYKENVAISSALVLVDRTTTMLDAVEIYSTAYAKAMKLLTTIGKVISNLSSKEAKQECISGFNEELGAEGYEAYLDSENQIKMKTTFNFPGHMSLKGNSLMMPAIADSKDSRQSTQIRIAGGSPLYSQKSPKDATDARETKSLCQL